MSSKPSEFLELLESFLGIYLPCVRGKIILPEFGRDFFPICGRENFLTVGR